MDGGCALTFAGIIWVFSGYYADFPVNRLAHQGVAKIWLLMVTSVKHIREALVAKTMGTRSSKTTPLVDMTDSVKSGCGMIKKCQGSRNAAHF